MSKFLNKTYASIVGALCFTVAIGAPAHAGGGWNGSNMTGGGHGCHSCWNGSNSTGTNNSNSTGGNHSNCRTGKCSNNSNSTGTNNSNASGYNNGNYNGFENLINDLKELMALLYGGKSEQADSLLNQLKDAASLSEAEWDKDPSKTAAQLQRLEAVALQLTNRLHSLAHSKNASSRHYLAAEKSVFIAIELHQAIASLGTGENRQVSAKLQQAQQKASLLIADIRSFAGSW